MGLSRTNPYAGCQPDTLTAKGESERARHASFRDGHRVAAAITQNNMQHSERATKTQLSLTTLQVQREDDSVSEPCSDRGDHHQTGDDGSVSNEASVSKVDTETCNWE